MGQGEDVLKRLGDLAGKLPVRIAVNAQKDKLTADLKLLASYGQSSLSHGEPSP